MREPLSWAAGRTAVLRPFAWVLLCLLLGAAPARADDPPGGPRATDPAAALDAALAAGRADEALFLVETTRAADLHAAVALRAELQAVAVPPSLLQAEADARGAVLRARAAHGAAHLRHKLAEARAALEALHAAEQAFHDAAARSRAYAREVVGRARPAPATAAELRAALGEDAACVHSVLRPEHAYALVTTHEATRVVDLGPPPPLLAALAALRPGDRESEVDLPLAEARRRWVAPLALPAAVGRVLWSPAGPLADAPLALLLGERDLVRIPSASVWRALAAAPPHPKARVLGLGDPDYRAQLRFAPLPASRGEVDAVADLGLVATEATETALTQALARDPAWRAVHLACHAILDAARPGCSALLLARDEVNDGWLTVDEILRLRVPCDLAVLSTVDSLRRPPGVPDEEFAGFGPAFLAAGARAVLGSLWKVDDRATAALMKRFHELWRPAQGEGLPAPEALRLAREHVRLQPAWAHPFYWAAWELLGAP